MRTLSLFFTLATMLFLTACGGSGSGEGEQAADSTAVEAAPAMNYTLTPFTPSTAFADANMESMAFKNGKFMFGISGYELGEQTPDADLKMCANSADGQHIHLIVDREPYAAKYTAEFDYQIPDGEHYVLAFLSRSYHESLKNPAAFKAEKVMVSSNSFTSQESITGPVLFYSRPKGNYVGEKDTKKVMLDFYLLNAQLGSDYQVKAEINGEVHMIDQWQPYYIEGLPMGENTIKLTLVDAQGNVVDAPLNPVERTFTLQADPAEAQ